MMPSPFRKKTVMRCFYINLQRRPDRLAHILKELDYLEMPYERIVAVDHRDLSSDKMHQYYDTERGFKEGRQLTSAEIACFLSHIKCWKKILEHNIPFAYVFEDDAMLSIEAKDIFREVNSVVSQYKISEASVVLFSHTKYYKNSNLVIKLKNGTALYESYGAPFCAHAYLITRDAIERLLTKMSGQKFLYPFDHNWRHWQDDRIIKLYSLVPFIATNNSKFESDIEETRQLKTKDTFAMHTRIIKKLRRHGFVYFWRFILGIKRQPFKQ